jgi:hypothetical protein
MATMLCACNHVQFEHDGPVCLATQCNCVRFTPAGTPARVSRGFYQHYKGPTYFVVGVGTLDADGHGNVDAPRQVVYESTLSVRDGLLRLRSEADFVALIEWPDGVVRPRFVRVDP